MELVRGSMLSSILTIHTPCHMIFISGKNVFKPEIRTCLMRHIDVHKGIKGYNIYNIELP